MIIVNLVLEKILVTRRQDLETVAISLYHPQG